MYCMNCGQQLPDSAKFCSKCGASQKTVSPTVTTGSERINLDGTHSLVPAMCPNCNAHMKVGQGNKLARCPSCGTECLVQDAVKALSVSGNVIVGNASINVVSNNDFEIVGGVLKKYSGASTNVNIPNNVFIIGERAFKGCYGVVSVQIPNSVIRIERKAFDGCSNLQRINLPDSINNIGSEAFNDCKSLQSVEIPTSLEEISYRTFCGCNSLKAIRIPENIKKIDEEAFFWCVNLRIIWPRSWDSKQLSKILIASKTINEEVGYALGDSVNGYKYNLVLNSYSTQNDQKYWSSVNCNSLGFFEVNEYLRTKPAQSSVGEAYNINYIYNRLVKLLDVAGIDRSCISTVSLPEYHIEVKGRSAYLSKCSTIQTGNMNMLQITIIEKPN